MHPQKTSLLQALQLPPDLTDEACTRSISELISLITEDRPHSVSLDDVYEAVSRYDCATYLEPLDVLPAMLPCPQDGAMALIRTCALNSSPKEVLIVVQEAIEYVQTRLNHEEDDGEDADDPCLVQRVIGIVALCSPAISRSRLGKRSALELCSPVLESITSLITSVSPLVTREQGRTLVAEVAGLVQSLSVWASAVTDADASQEIKGLLRELLDTTVVSCASSIQASLAVRAAESCFPRYFVKSVTTEGWRDGSGTMLKVQLALESLGPSPQTMRKPSSFSELVYLAHATPPVALPSSALSDVCHLLVGALQMNVIVDESLFLLIRMLTHEHMDVSPDVATSLCTVLTALASTHIDPSIRQVNLRLLSLTLSKLPPHPRLEMLLRLTTNEDFPQIRGPAVGLVKEAVLEALMLPANRASRNPFASPELLRTFGGVVFKSNPPSFLGERKTGEELARSLELLRIADCLSFYYVLLQRDRENRTGVRTQENVGSVETSLLRPLRRFLEENSTGEERRLMAILSLQAGLDRIDGALQTLGLKKDE